MIAVEIVFSLLFIFESTIDWYSELKKDYSKSLDSFHVINYIRHDYYNRGISEINFISSQKIFFYELVDGKKKKVTYQILKTQEGLLLKRKVTSNSRKSGVNYLGPFDMKLEFADSKDFIVLKSSIGNFLLPKNIPDRELILGVSVE